MVNLFSYFPASVKLDMNASLEHKSRGTPARLIITN